MSIAISKKRKVGCSVFGVQRRWKDLVNTSEQHAHIQGVAHYSTCISSCLWSVFMSKVCHSPCDSLADGITVCINRARPRHYSLGIPVVHASHIFHCICCCLARSNYCCLIFMPSVQAKSGFSSTHSCCIHQTMYDRSLWANICVLFAWLHILCFLLTAQFIADGVFYAELNELLTRELSEDGEIQCFRVDHPLSRLSRERGCLHEVATAFHSNTPPAPPSPTALNNSIQPQLAAETASTE